MDTNNAVQRVEDKRGFVVKVQTASWPVYCSWVKTVKGRPTPRFAPRVEQVFATRDEADLLARRVRGLVEVWEGR